MQMPDRNYSSATYRYGFNGQEKSDEIAEGTTTALFWEYDSRIARRWNIDPKPRIWESSYMCFRGNPIILSDIDGDTTRMYNSEGRLLGTDNRGTNNLVFISEAKNDRKATGISANASKFSEEQLLNNLKSLGTVYDIGSIVNFYKNNYGKGTITQISDAQLKDIYNIKINGVSVTKKQLMARLKKEGIGAEYATSLKYVNGILTASPEVKTSNDAQLVKETGKPIVHMHPNSKKILEITFNVLENGHKVPNQTPTLFEVRPYSPVDTWDQAEAKKFYQHNTSIRNVVIEKNYIFIYSGKDYTETLRIDFRGIKSN